VTDAELKANAVRGRAILVCAGDCQQETGPYPGVLSKEERGDEGRIFFPDEPYSCSECDTEEFCWTWFESARPHPEKPQGRKSR
jgi:hypothetical protein